MDSLTQIVLGAAVGEAVLGRKVGNKAMFWGAVAGTIPDLDALGKFFLDTVTANEIHRGFSHSLFFSLLFAPIFGWLVFHLYKKKKATWKEWTKLFFWGLFTHPLLDMHTTWGTQLLWPLETKFAYNNIFVIDPLYTLPFLTCLLLAMFQKRATVKRARFNNWGLYLSSGYMLLTLILKGLTYQVFKTDLHNKQIAYVELETKPTPMNTILWTANVETSDAFLIGYYSLFDGTKDIVWKRFEKNHQLLTPYKDDPMVGRLQKLTHNWYTVEQKSGKMYLNDLRFGVMGIASDETRFVFSYELTLENGLLKASESPKEFSESKVLLQQLWHRIRGVK